MPSFEVGNRRIGSDAPTFFIAELSANHGNSIDVAKRTIEAAAKAGADAIKLQTYTPDTLTLKSSAPPFVVQMKNEWVGRTLHDLYAEAMTPWEWHAELKKTAESCGMICFSTPFDATATAFLDGLGMEIFKVASFEIADLPLVERIARLGKPMIISTGMASLGDIEAAVAVCRQAGNDRLALLRCVSCYPARPDVMNLESIRTLASFGTVVGLSDHTRDATVAIASVALGARVIEKHFILERSIGGPDSFFSLEPDEFASMVKAVRDTEVAMGAPRFGVSADEVASSRYRRSLFIARDVAEGAVLTCDDVRSVRPADGLPPRALPLVLGRRAAKPLTAATPLTWDSIGPVPDVSSVELRIANADDAREVVDLLLATRTVANAQEADAWFAKAIAGNARLLVSSSRPARALVALAPGSAGTGSWNVSLVVSSEAGGADLASAMLVNAERAAREAGAVYLTASIATDDASTIGAYKNAGYYGFTTDARQVHCERRLTPYPS